MLFPYGEWIILFLTLVTWVEKHASRRFFLMMTIAWFTGKCIEIVTPVILPWNWHFARLGVMLFFGAWAFKHAEKRFLPLLFTTLITCGETLFFVNEPGVFPYGSWIFALVLVLVAWLSTKSYWGTAAALTGSLLLNQVFARFTYDGIVRYADLPNEFDWNFGVGLFMVWAGLRLGWQFYMERVHSRDAEQVLSNTVGVYETSKERELK